MSEIDITSYNAEPLNQQAAVLLKQAGILYNPQTELAALVLIREALERNLLEMAVPEPLLLIAKLAANPAWAMALMTESEPGVKFTMNLADSLPEAAAQIMEEIIASLEAIPQPS
jgi:hypothetical protein